VNCFSFFESTEIFVKSEYFIAVTGTIVLIVEYFM